MVHQHYIRVLYMEDDTLLAQAVQRRLQQEGYRVDLADNGAFGIVKFESGVYDVLIVDAEMPFYSGLDVIRTLAARDSLPATIMVTDSVDGRSAVEAMKLGVADYIVKNTQTQMVYTELLNLVLHQILTKQQLSREKEELFAAIRESEERYRQLVDLSPSGIVIYAGGKIEFINATGLKLLGGQTEKDIFAVHPAKFIHPEEREMVRENLKIIRAGAQIVWEPRRLIRLDGSQIIAEVLSVGFIYKGHPAVWIVFQDITERVQAEQALRQSEERFRTVANFTYDWEYWIDPQGTLVYTSPSCERITGYRPAEFRYAADLLLTIIHPEDRPMMQNHLYPETQPPVLCECDFRIVTRDGYERWIGHICQPVYGNDGNFLGRRASNRDITAIKNTENTLRAREEMYRALFENANDAIFIENDRDEIVDVNHRACEMMGYTRAELLRMKVPDLQAPEVRGTLGQVIKTELQRYGGTIFNGVNLHKNGTRIPVEISVSQIPAPNQGLALSIVRKLTPRHSIDSDSV